MSSEIIRKIKVSCAEHLGYTGIATYRVFLPFGNLALR